MLLENEKLLKAVSTHWMKYTRPAALIALIAPPAFLLIFAPVFVVESFQIGAYTPFFLGVCLSTFVLHWGFHRILNESMVDVIITNRRVIYLQSSPLFNDVMREFHMERIRAVEGRKTGLFQNIFGYGSLSVNTEGSGFRESESIVQFMPDPNTYSQIIISAMEEAGILKIREQREAEPVEAEGKQNSAQHNATHTVHKKRRGMRKKLTGR